MELPCFELNPGKLTLAEVQQLHHNQHSIVLAKSCFDNIHASEAMLNDIVARDEVTYGVNTGFGLLANKKISADELTRLQENLILSHATGVGEYLSPQCVRMILLLKINALAQGFSGVRIGLIEFLVELYNRDIIPLVPSKGSVGASGDLAPLAHLALPILGQGDVRYHGVVMPAKEGLAKVGLQAITLGPKEGLALINGTQVSTAIAIEALLKIENCFQHAIVAGCMSTDAVLATDVPFDPLIQYARKQEGQKAVAGFYRDILAGSQIRESHLDCERVQDPYSIRCQPQVMGAVLDQIRFAASRLELEMNAVSDNPLVFKGRDILSGGNFHAAPVAFAADNLALAIAEIGSLAERRIALLIDSKLSSLPSFLVEDSGVNSGFMIAHVTAAALVSENKMLSHPASVDTIPTSAGQEDHVSMATHAAQRLHVMAENTLNIISIELLAAAQGIELRAPLQTSELLQGVIRELRKQVDFYDKDRFFKPDIDACSHLIRSRVISDLVSNMMAVL